MECPYCQSEIEVSKGRCPVCKSRLYEVTEEDFQDSAPGAGEASGGEYEDLSLEEAIQSRYRCAKCGGEDCIVKRVAVTGTGLSKIFDIQHNHYLFVSCEQCGSVDIYDPDVLLGGRL